MPNKTKSYHYNLKIESVFKFNKFNIKKIKVKSKLFKNLSILVNNNGFFIFLHVWEFFLYVNASMTHQILLI